MHAAHRSGAALRIGAPFLGIDVDQVAQTHPLAPAQTEHVRRHVGGRDDDRFRPDGAERLPHPAREPAVAVEGDAERLAGQQPGETHELGPAPVEPSDVRALAQRLDGRHVFLVGRVVEQAAKMDVVAPAQMA